MDCRTLPHGTDAPTTLEQALQQLAASELALARLQAAQEGLMRAVSHDLRAPLRHLTSFAPLLREAVQELAAATPGEVAEEALEFAGTMEQSARKMGRMLEALLQLSRAERQPLEVQAVELGGVLQACARQVDPALNVEGWSLPVQPVQLQADPQALHTVLQALLGNAVKFSGHQPAQQVRVKVSAPAAPGCCRIEVSDNGVGCDATRLDTSWPPFQRMHRESEFPGEGCGLALAHLLARRHGATLQLQSSPGMGCTAVLEWPATA